MVFNWNQVLKIWPLLLEEIKEILQKETKVYVLIDMQLWSCRLKAPSVLPSSLRHEGETMVAKALKKKTKREANL